MVNSTDDQIQREIMVEWCSLLTGYSATYFEQKNNDELLKDYIELMSSAADNMMLEDSAEEKGRKEL